MPKTFGPLPPPLTKRGQHGTLYRYQIEYRDPYDAGFGVGTWRTWAYDMEHAVEKFYDSDNEFEAIGIQRVQEDGKVRHDTPYHKLV